MKPDQQISRATDCQDELRTCTKIAEILEIKQKRLIAVPHGASALGTPALLGDLADALPLPDSALLPRFPGQFTSGWVQSAGDTDQRKGERSQWVSPFFCTGLFPPTFLLQTICPLIAFSAPSISCETNSLN